MRRCGSYELLAEIARGGMGVVFKARQCGLDRHVALKMVLSGRKATPTELERFAREARAAAALDHPNIVAVYDNGWHEGHPYFTMALVEGTSLHRRVQESGVPEPREAVHLMRAVADAVAYAHGRGVIHRDLKPHNVLLDLQGRPRVADFGLARCTQEAEGLTATGEVLGTPNYMAPEQALGLTAALGPTVDVYGLGGIFYFLLTGQPPFSGPTVISVLRHVVDDPPVPPVTLNAAVPLALQEICLKCLEKDPEHRYPSAVALAEALAEWEAISRNSGRAQGEVAAGRPGPTGTLIADPLPARAPLRRHRVAVSAAVGLVAGVALLVPWSGSWRAPSTSPTPTTPTTAPAPEVPITPLELPRRMRRDFGLAVSLVGGREGADGIRVFREDEPVRFRVETKRDAYVGIWNIGPDGTIVQLFPNSQERDHLVRQGHIREVPGKDDYTINATVTAAGKAEAVRVVAATRRWDALEGERIGPFVVLRSDEDRQRFERHLRGFEVRPKTAPPSPTEDAVAEDAMLFRVLPR
jgi:tRNA A-37 threonylcarbamoyl transferase component Bud32